MNQQALIDSWRMFEKEHGVSVDRMICSPELRKEFLETSECDCDNEEEIPWSLMRLRKSKHLTIQQKILTFSPQGPNLSRNVV